MQNWSRFDRGQRSEYTAYYPLYLTSGFPKKCKESLAIGACIKDDSRMHMCIIHNKF